MSTGISNAGESAEGTFRRLTGATKTSSAALGDADLEGFLVEVKKASSMTLNQVRAVKYITLVALYTPTNTWFVVPPHEVVRLVAAKGRGQHTENPFESATLSISKLNEYKVEDIGSLPDIVKSAAKRGDEHPELKRAMVKIREDSARLAAESKELVSRILAA